MNELSKKLETLSDLLWGLPFTDVGIPDEQQMSIEMIIDLARETDCADKMIEIINANSDKELGLVDSLFFDAGLYPPIEFVDDDELDDDEYD